MTGPRAKHCLCGGSRDWAGNHATRLAVRWEKAMTPLHECVERLHAAGYVVLGPENAAETAVLLGMIVFPFWEQIPALEEETVRDRAAAVLAAFPTRNDG